MKRLALFLTLPAVSLSFGVGCLRPSAHVEGSYTPAAGGEREPVEADESVDSAQASPCALADGALQLELIVPAGYILLASPEACMLVDERAEDPRLMTFHAIPLTSETPGDAALRQGVDGVRRWALEGGLLGEGADARGEGNTTLGGAALDYFVVRATPPELGVERDVLLLRHLVGVEQLVVMLFTPPDEAEARAELLDLLARVEIRETP